MSRKRKLTRRRKQKKLRDSKIRAEPAKMGPRNKEIIINQRA